MQRLGKGQWMLAGKGCTYWSVEMTQWAMARQPWHSQTIWAQPLLLQYLSNCSNHQLMFMEIFAGMQQSLRWFPLAGRSR
jgi:hypothetical protein